jgi:hypothetical protein
MNKLTNAPTARRVSHSAATASNRTRKVDPAWNEFAEHLMIETLPVVAVALELGRSLKAGRVPLRAFLLMAVLAI